MYRICPLLTAMMYRDKGLMTYTLNYGTMVWLPVVAWLVEGNGRRLLVDTGAPVEAVRAARDLPTEHVATLGECLETHGVAIGEIDTVILTHLHYDHIGFLPLFKHARVYVQKSELDAAYRPHPLQKNIYNTDLLEGVNFEAISGEAEIVEGVSVFPVPGHSAGAQAVAIQTSKGKAVISGLCTLRDNFYPPSDVAARLEVVVPGQHMNAVECYESLLKVKRVADIIIPQHDLDIATGGPIPEGSDDQ